jgi:hypothetical protein
MSDPSSLASQGSSVSVLDSLLTAYHDAHWNDAWKRKALSTLVSKFGGEDKSTCSAEEAQSIFSAAATVAQQQDESGRKLLSFYGLDPEKYEKELHEEAQLLSIYDPDKYIPSDTMHGTLMALNGQELVDEAWRLTALKRTKLTEILQDGAKKINEEFGLQGENAIKAPEVRDPEGDQPGNDANEAESVKEGEGK